MSICSDTDEARIYHLFSIHVPSLNGVCLWDFESHVDHLVLQLMVDWSGVKVVFIDYSVESEAHVFSLFSTTLFNQAWKQTQV